MEAGNCSNSAPSVASFIPAKLNSKKPIISTSNASELDSHLQFLNSFEQTLENEIIEDFVRNVDLKSADSSSQKSFLSYIFNPSRLLSVSKAFSLLSKELTSLASRHVVLVDCNSIDSKTELFTRIFSEILGSEAASQLALSFDFAGFQTLFNSLKLSRSASSQREVVILLLNSSQLDISYLDDFVSLWERRYSDFKVPVRLSFVMDDSGVFIGMPARLRDRFAPLKSSFPNSQVFNRFLVAFVGLEGLHLWLHPFIIEYLLDLENSGALSVKSLVRRIKFLLISHFSKPAVKVNDVASHCSDKSKMLLFINSLASCVRARCACAPEWKISDFYVPLFQGKLLASDAFNSLSNELKSLAPHDFVSVFKDALKQQQESGGKLSSFIKTFVEGTIVKGMAVGISGNMDHPTSIHQLKDVQFDLIGDFGRFCNEGSLATSFESPQYLQVVIRDEMGILRKAFDADPQAALQVALKHPGFYLNGEGLGSIPLDRMVRFSDFPAILKTANRVSLPDTCLLYRLTLEFNQRSINLYDLFGSFRSVLNESQSTPLLIARFFKAVNELQLLGMLSEFGSSKRKQRTIDRYNLSDSLEQVY